MLVQIMERIDEVPSQTSRLHSAPQGAARLRGGLLPCNVVQGQRVAAVPQANVVLCRETGASQLPPHNTYTPPPPTLTPSHRPCLT